LSFIAAETVGAAVVAGIAAIAGPLALVASVVGVILFFVFMKKKDPLNRFLEDYAKPTYYMEVTAIDYFAIARTARNKDGITLGTGLALHPVTLSWEDQFITRDDTTIKVHHYTVNRDDAKAVAVDANGAATVGSFAHAWGDVLSLDVDASGLSQFYSQSPERNTSKTMLLGLADGHAVALDAP